MLIDSLTVGPLMTNCYLFGCEATREAAIIDPGGDADKIVARVEELSLTPVWIIDTHGHADHIGAQEQIKTRFPEARIAIHEADAACLTSPGLNLSAIIEIPLISPMADLILQDGDKIAVGELALEVLFVPGHTPGSTALYAPAATDAGQPAVFSGDLIFAGSIGRTDFAGGAMDELLTSIRERLFLLPPHTLIYPGHGEPTTIEHEARFNSFLT